jgi:hypothetical protein
MAEASDLSRFDSTIEHSLSDVEDRAESRKHEIVHEEEVFSLLPEQFKKPDIGDPYADERSDDGTSN